ncbi:hypothetical protein SAMN04515648_1344 [Phyllobacterium sp. CL33Tsu]|nr:hypothetical protein SAMN04515648_1344 [Phyllobacterium sp. CL33Tsu]
MPCARLGAPRAMSALLSAFTVYFLYAMSSVPCLVWAGRSAYAGTIASREPRPWPGTARTILWVALPLLLIFLYAWNVSDTASGAVNAEAEGASDWMPYQFLLLPSALGSIAGYGIGFIMGKRRVA